MHTPPHPASCLRERRTFAAVMAAALALALTADDLAAQAEIAQVEPNDSMGTATATGLTAGSSTGIVSLGNNGDGPHGPTSGDGSGDFDFLSFEAEAGQTILVDVDAQTIGRSIDTVAGLYDGNGTLVAANDDDDGPTTDSLIEFVAPATGTYYAVVGSWVSGPVENNLPADPSTPGGGIGSPGSVDDYEVVVGLDMPVFLVASPLDFAAEGPDEPSGGLLRLTNFGSQPATVTGLAITGPDAPSFSVDQAVPFTIPAGGFVEVPLVFDAGGSTDPKFATLTIASDDAARPMHELPLEAKAVGPLLFRLAFDDPTGAPIASFDAPLDISGNGYQAAYVSNQFDPVFEQPPLVDDGGFSVGFGGAGGTPNYVLTANGFPHTPSVSYSLWIRPGAGQGDATLFNRDPNWTLSDAIFGCTIRADDSLVFRIAGADVVWTDPGTIVDGETYHVVVTHLDEAGFGDFEADRTRLYLNGALVMEETFTFEFPTYDGGGSNSRLWIATRSAAGTGYTGLMDDFQLYNVELSTEQVAQLFENPGTVIGSSPPAPFLVTAITRDPATGEITLTWNSRSRRTYAVDRAFVLDGVWSEIDDGVPSGGTETTFTDAGVPEEEPSVFYRVRDGG